MSNFLSVRQKDVPSATTKVLSIQAWEADGRPEMWRIASKSGRMEVWLDVGFGKIALFNGVEVVCSEYITDVLDGYIALDAEYYGTEGQYLFCAEEGTIQPLYAS